MKPTENELERRALALVEEALDRPGAERRDWLQAECEGRPELLERTLDLLERAPETEDAALGPAGPRLADPSFVGLLPGDRLGHYVVERELGRGGMGVVHLARRVDATFELEVAIKTITAPWRAGLAKVFEDERRILARLRHPNIAHVIDGGTTEEGLPYLVMEYVDGEPLAAYCDRRRLPVRQRLELLAQVCDGVEHAHRHLVVHRDLKPGNILVTGEGRVKLLDFGIARLLDEQGRAEVSTSTRWGVRALTPEYASPEQRLAEPVTTLSDVYSLGVLLYELLTGERPRAKGTTSGRSTSDLTTPVPPSRCRPSEDAAAARDTTAAKLSRHLRGDLDLITGTALREIPTERYRSAGALAEDLRLHLAGRPIRARPLTLGYLAGRFLRRHAVPTAVVTAALVALLVAGIFSVRQSLHAAQEGERRQRMGDFLETLLAATDPVRGLSREASLAELVAFAEDRLAADFPGDPGIRGSLRRTLAGSYLNLGEPEKAKPLFELALEEHREAYGEKHPETLETRRLLAIYEQTVGDFEASLRRIDSVLEDLEAFPDERLLRALSLGHRGATLSSLGRVEEALVAFRECLELLEDLEQTSDDALDMLNNMAVAQIGADRPEDAVRTLRGAIRRAGEDSALVGRMHTNLGLAHRELGALGDAEMHLERGADLLAERLGAVHPETLLSRIALSEVLRDLERLVEADAEMSSVVATAQATLPEQHYLLPYARTVHAQILVALGRGAEAEPLARLSLEARQRSLPEGHWLIASAQTTLAAALLLEGRRDEAVELLVPAHRVLLEARGADFAKTEQARALLDDAGVPATLWAR